MRSPMTYIQLKKGASPGDTDGGDTYQEGFKKGVKDGYRHAIDRLESATGSVRKAVEDMKEMQNTLSMEAEKNIMSLAMAMARKIVGNEISTNPKTLGQVIDKTLKQIETNRKMTLRLNPVDLKVIQDSKIILSTVKNHSKYLNIESDDMVSRGGCIVETGSNILDARIEKQFQEMEHLIAEVNGG